MPKLTGGGNKRRMPDAPTPEMLKRMKLDSEEQAAPKAVPVPISRKVTVEDVDEGDGDAGIAMEEDDFAPGGDADYFAEEDDEGRFFGGGLTSEQKEILNIFDKAGDENAPDDVRARLALYSVIKQTLINFIV
jgi:beta-catenin-like protein 1